MKIKGFKQGRKGRVAKVALLREGEMTPFKQKRSSLEIQRAALLMWLTEELTDRVIRDSIPVKEESDHEER
jgi:hypothetical protein